MKRIPIEKAKPGMVLAQKVVRHDGVLLCQKGATLTEPMLSMLERMNFETVPVEVESTETPEEKKKRLKKAEAELKFRFSRVMSDPVLRALGAALLKRIREAD